MSDEKSSEKETNKMDDEEPPMKVEEESEINKDNKTECSTEDDGELKIDDKPEEMSADESKTDINTSQASDCDPDTDSQTIEDIDQSDIINNENTELLDKSRSSDTKPKWKLKIRMNQGSPEKSKEWKVVEDEKPQVENTDNNDSCNTDQEMIDVCTPSETPKMVADVPLTSAPGKRKIKKKSLETLTTPAKKPKGGLRSDCPPFCKTNCTLEHHPLLVGARKMIENDSGTTLVFLDLINSYYGGSNGNLQASDSIFDPGKNTNFPLLHYIALMGKCAGCFAMVDAGHEPENVVTEDGDTVLHVMVKEMYVFNCTHGHMDILLKKFNLLLKEFKNCLIVTNKSWQNPLHLCADLISQTAFQCAQPDRGKPPFRLYQFQKNMLTSMLDQFKNDGLESSMLNMTDNKQNTFSHYLARDRASHDLLDIAKEMGADLTVCNNENMNVEQVMDNAPPPPPEDILEMAAFSAKGRKYKNSHQKPIITTGATKSPSMTTKSPSMTKSKRTVKPSAKAKAVEEDLMYETFSRDIIKIEKKKEKRTVQKPVVDLTETHDLPTIPTSQIISGLSNIKGKVRVKVTPTRKEKEEEKISKKLAKLQAKENSKNGDSPKVIVIGDAPSSGSPSPDSSLPNSLKPPIFKVILPKAPLTNSSASNNTLPNGPAAMIAKVKPTIITKQVNPPIGSDPKPMQNKLEISPMLPNNIRPPTTIVVNQALSQKVGPFSVAQPQSSINQPQRSPILIKTAEGQVLQLRNISPEVIQANQATTINQRAPLQCNQAKPLLNGQQVNQNRGVQMMGMQMRQLPVHIGSLINGKPQIRHMNQPNIPPINVNINSQQQKIVPVNVNGQWALRYPTPMTSPLGQMQRGPVSSNHYHQPLQSFIQNRGFPPANTHPRNMFPSPSMVPNQPLRMVQAQRLQPPIINPPTIPLQGNTNQSIVSPLPLQTSKQHEVINTKRGRKLEASIKNLQNISMEIISRNFGSNDKPQGTPKTSPDTKPPPPTSQPLAAPQPQEVAPPVYIIDTDDEQHILTEEMTKKKTPPSPTPSTDGNKVNDSEEVNHKEHIAEKRCNYQVELPFNTCQHFEQFLIINRLKYAKIECQGDHQEPGTSSNPFLPENDSNRNQFVENTKDLAVELLEWFSLNKHLCKEHFARLILQENRRHLEDLLSMVDLQEHLSTREVEDMIKIKHFLRNPELRRALSCPCGDSFDDTEIAHQHHHQQNHHNHHSNNHHYQESPQQPTPRSPLIHQHRKAFWEDNLISQREVHQIAEALKAWLHRNHWVSQGYFATHYLNRSQGTISHLLRWATAPTSRQGEEVWHRIKHFLENKELQDSFSLKAKKYKASQTSSSSSSYQQPISNSMTHQEPLPSSSSQDPTTSSTIPSQEQSAEPDPQPEGVAQSAPTPTLVKTTVSSTADSHLQVNLEPLAQPSSSIPSHDIHIGAFDQEDIHQLADHLQQWLYRNPIISQARFSKHILQRSQGTLSSLLKMRCMPISRAGYEVWHKIRDFLNDTDKQETLLRNYGWVGSFKEVKAENGDENRAPAEEAVLDASERREDRKRPHPDNRIPVKSEDNHSSLHPPPDHPPHVQFPSISRIDDPSAFGPMSRPSQRGPTPDVPTMSVSPYKVKRLGEFDQDTVTRLADQLKDWLDNQTRVSQGLFAQRVLARSQGTLSLLLTRKTAPISTSGEEVWKKIRDFLHDERKQIELIHFANQQN